MLEIVSREEWDARSPKSTYKINLYQPRLILHHAAGAVVPGDDKVSDADLRRIGAIQDYHMDSRGWNDIAYSFLTDPDGYLFEGRGVGVANGATKGFGTTSYAICVMGNFDKQAPEDELIEQLATAVVWGYREGYWPLGFTGGHRNYGSTSCPGSKLYPKIPEINQLAKELHNMANTFKDVPTTHPHYSAIEWLAKNGITKGTNPPKNDMFSPESPVTRAQMATFLMRLHDLDHRADNH